MKAWDDNFVTDTGTAHDGRVITTALSLSFLCLLSTVLPYLTVFADTNMWSIFLVPPKCDSNRSNFVEKYADVTFDFAMKTVCCRFITSVFNSAIYWRKEIRKDKFVFVLTRWWTASGAREICKTEWEWRDKETKRERGIWRKKRCFLCFTWKTVRHTDKAIM